VIRLAHIDGVFADSLIIMLLVVLILFVLELFCGSWILWGRAAVTSLLVILRVSCFISRR